MEIEYEIFPDTSAVEEYLERVLPDFEMSSMDFYEDVLKGNWVLEPTLLWEYIKETVFGDLGDLKTLLISILVLFILSSVMTSVMEAFRSDGTAKVVRFFFLLSLMGVLLAAFQRVMTISIEAVSNMLEFMKIALPVYMITVAAAGAGLTAMLFYKLLLGVLCLIEGMVVSNLVPIIEAYMMLGILEAIEGEDRFRSLKKLLKKGILGFMKLMILVVNGSGLIQMIITPVIDKANLAVAQKTAGAIPGIGDIAQAASGIAVTSAVVIKNSLGVFIMVIMVVILLIPVMQMFAILATMKVGCALGEMCGEKRLVSCTESISDAGFMLLRLLITVSALFFITVAMLTHIAGGTM